jgi:hypothetical protein
MSILKENTAGLYVDKNYFKSKKIIYFGIRTGKRTGHVKGEGERK